jgi:DNA (cytosine-5)-methyltransferase 1
LIELYADTASLASEETEAVGPVDIYGSTRIRARSSPSATRPQVRPQAQVIEIDRYKLRDNTHIRPQDFVELVCPQHRQADTDPSGDIIRVKTIFRYRLTGEVTIKGHRFMRERYVIGASFQGEHPRPDTRRSEPLDERKKARVNELVQHFTVREDDNRPAEVQGLEEIQISLVKRKRTVILTDKSYPVLSFRNDPKVRKDALLAGPSKADQKLYIIHNGPLVCRSSWISVQSPNDKVYGGEWRYLSKKALSPPRQVQKSHAHGHTPLKLSHETAQRHARAMAESDRPRVYRFKQPSKNGRYIYIDAYCGAGGASQGARQAGLKILGGLDHDETAIQAWANNNPGAIYLNMDSFDFLSNENWKILGRCDILNISNPCQPFSPSQYVYFGFNCRTTTDTSSTIDGKNDEANIAQLHAIKSLIEALKPRVVILENTSGLVNLTENQPYFRKIIYDISSAGAGYNLRYKIINMADYGLPQERKRLIIIAAK